MRSGDCSRVAVTERSGPPPTIISGTPNATSIGAVSKPYSAHRKPPRLVWRQRDALANRLNERWPRLLSVPPASEDARKVWFELTGERPAGDSKLKVDPATWWDKWGGAQRQASVARGDR